VALVYAQKPDSGNVY